MAAPIALAASNLKTEGWIVLGIIAIVLLFVIKGTLKRIIPDIGGAFDTGIGSITETNKEFEQAITSMTELFSPNFYKNFPSVELMPRSTAERLAKQIRDAWGIFNDDEAAISNALNQAQSQAQISQIADAYSRLYNQDLLTVLENGLSKSEINQLWNLLRIKPRTVR